MAVNLLEKINSQYSDFSKGQKRIADYIKNHCAEAAYMTAQGLGEAAEVSESTVVRFAIELGFDGYPELHRAMQETLRVSLTSVQRMEVANTRYTEENVLDTVLNADAERIRLTLDSIDRKAFSDAVDAIAEAGKVFVLGMRSSYSLAEFVQYNLGLILPNVQLVHNAGGSEIFEHLMSIGKGDVLIAISFPRYSKRIVNAVDFANDQGARVVSITDSEASPIAGGAYAPLYCAGDMASFADSLVAPMSVINALLAAIGFKKKEQVTDSLRRLEEAWDKYNVYEKK